MQELLQMLSYPFMIRALIVGIMVSLCSSLLGTSLVLKRYSMIGCLLYTSPSPRD